MSPALAEEREKAGAWASLLVRIAISSLFFASAVAKWMGGFESIESLVDTLQKQFTTTWLPTRLVLVYLYLTPFVETILPFWLLVGVKLKTAWVVTTLYLISLAFGKIVLQDYGTAANNYNYVLIGIVGLYLSAYDRFNLRPRRPGRVAASVAPATQN